MTKLLSCIFLTVLSTSLFAQNALLQNKNRLAVFTQQRKDSNLLASIPFTNIGPTIMSGRVVDIDVNPSHPEMFYVAYASGGVWLTENNGFSFRPVFDNEATHTIGDIAVNWKENIVWIGTGEANSSRSSYAGLGIYKSIDSCKTWQHAGLIATQHIGKILLSEKDKNTAFVASMGSLYTEKEGAAGIYKTTNGGQEWNKLNVGAAHIGFMDIQFDPNSEKTLYATSWERSRKAWNFIGQGENSAIYKSNDDGITWKCITGNASGFPKNNGTGRIGISVSAKKPNLLYALLDNQNRQETKKNKEKTWTALGIKELKEVDFLNLPDDKINTYLKENDYPEKYTAKSIKEDIRQKKYDVAAVANWVLSDADAALFQTPVIGAELYKSENGGTTWTKTHAKSIEGLYFTYGYYFGNVYINPTNDQEVFLLGYSLLKSNDGGKTFKEISQPNVHADHHRLWINPKNAIHLINGNDGGINVSFDGGKKWMKANNPPVGQFYTVAVDNAEPYNVYGGLQDNGTWVGPSTYKENDGWHQEGVYAYKEIGGGDGMQVQIDLRDNATVYTGYQFGYYQKSNRLFDKGITNIHPTQDIGENPLRYNWQTPIWLSKHNNDILYMASNKFHRSMEQGKNMIELGNDLAPTNKKGNVPYGTATSIMESPLQFGLIYIGTDNGKIYKSSDVGNSFQEIKTGYKDVDDQLWVSRIIASKHNKERVYASFNGYRNDDFKPYLFCSNDQGITWNKIGNLLPPEPINVIREDPKKNNIIYLGTDNGLYVSWDTGKTFIPWQANLPRVAIHDIAVQERENDIVLGTHGRSIYKASLKNIQNFASDTSKGFHLDSVKNLTYSDHWGKSWASYIVKTNKGKIIYTIQDTAKNGYNVFNYNGKINPKQAVAMKISESDNGAYYLNTGNYTLEIICNDKISSSNLIVEAEKK
jgi:photosystem II stability/assembly factor-like uncharacterized protein